jgi:hypothetical protein
MQFRLLLALSVAFAAPVLTVPAGSESTVAQRAIEMQSFLSERAQIGREVAGILSNQDNTPAARLQAFRTWCEQNKARLEGFKQRTKELAPVTSQLALIEAVEIPANTTPKEEEYLLETARMHNELTQALEQVPELSVEAWEQTFAQGNTNNKSRLDAQRTRARNISAATAAAAIHVPKPPNILPYASQEERAFLTLRFALAREQIQEEDRIRSLPLGEQNSARREWQRLNADRIALVKGMAAQLQSRISAYTSSTP